ncbi:tetratricopeptide repeat protein [Ekhidna sp.]|uniref:tetratricopeptide repeat protein n=1 Tax=Ekhidna sp. TaxID=2608089 RepID=UPI003B5146B0
MRLSINIILCFIAFNIHAADKIAQDLDSITSLLRTGNYQDTKSLIFDLKPEYDNSGDFDWLVKTNYFLGYIFKEEGDFGKSIIYYLEAIRYAEESQSELYSDDLISLYNRCGIIFRKFKSYNLAIEYYSKGLALAHLHEKIKNVININYNLAGIYLDQEDYTKAARLLESLLAYEEISTRKYYDVLNRLCFAFLKNENYDAAKRYAALIIDKPDESGPKLSAYAYHNLGTIASIHNEYETSDQFFDLGLNFIQSDESLKDKSGEFKLLHDRGKNLVQWGKIADGMDYFEKAEGLISEINQHPEYFNLYKDFANAYYNHGDYSLSKKYEDLYYENLNAYLSVQEEIQETDKRYNMDLITKRYFDEVAKQERIATILLYSKLISGTLLILLLFSVGYNYYQKVKLRRSIIKELIDLKVIN